MLLSLYSLLLTREELYNLIVDCEVSLESNILNSYNAEIGIAGILDLEDALYYSNTIYLDNLLDLALTCSQNIGSLNNVEFDQSISVMDYITTVNSGIGSIDDTTGAITGLIPVSYQNAINIDVETTPTCTSWLSYGGYVTIDTVVDVIDTFTGVHQNVLIITEETTPTCDSGIVYDKYTTIDLPINASTTLTGSPQNSIAIDDETTPICVSTVNYTGFIIADELAAAEVDAIAQGLNGVNSTDEFDIEAESNIILTSNADIINTLAISTQLSIYGYNQIDISESIALMDNITRTNTMYSSIENVVSLQPSVNLVYNKDVLVSCIIDIDSTIKAFQYFKVRKWDMKIRSSLNLTAFEKSLNLRKVDREIKLNKVERTQKWSLVNRSTSPWTVTVLT